jgi:two-component system response regulator HydG
MAKAALLLVDDDEMSSQILGFILADEGYDVDLATTGGAAIEKCAQKRYDLIFLDYVLPDVRGHDVAEKLKQVSPNVKIVLLSGFSNEGEEIGKLYERVLLKPVPPDVIVKTISEILG